MSLCVGDWCVLDFIPEENSKHPCKIKYSRKDAPIFLDIALVSLQYLLASWEYNGAPFYP